MTSFLHLVDSSRSAEYTLTIEPLVLQCLRTNKPETCQEALAKLEAIQRKAAFEKNYSCQTYALGLGADLIMSQLSLDREDYSLAMLAKIKNICALGDIVE